MLLIQVIALSLICQFSMTQLTGYVFIDDNSNGRKEQYEAFYEAAVFSVGFNVTTTGKVPVFEDSSYFYKPNTIK